MFPKCILQGERKSPPATFLWDDGAHNDELICVCCMGSLQLNNKIWLTMITTLRKWYFIMLQSLTQICKMTGVISSINAWLSVKCYCFCVNVLLLFSVLLRSLFAFAHQYGQNFFLKEANCFDIPVISSTHEQGCSAFKFLHYEVSEKDTIWAGEILEQRPSGTIWKVYGEARKVGLSLAGLVLHLPFRGSPEYKTLLWEQYH